MATTARAPKHVLFVIDYKVTMHGEGKQRSLGSCRHNQWSGATVERKRLTWFLKLSIKSSLLQINYIENVANKVTNTQ